MRCTTTAKDKNESQRRGGCEKRTLRRGELVNPGIEYIILDFGEERRAGGGLVEHIVVPLGAKFEKHAACCDVSRRTLRRAKRCLPCRGIMFLASPAPHGLLSC